MISAFLYFIISYPSWRSEDVLGPLSRAACNGGLLGTCGSLFNSNAIMLKRKLINMRRFNTCMHFRKFWNIPPFADLKNNAVAINFHNFRWKWMLTLFFSDMKRKFYFNQVINCKGMGFPSTLYVSIDSYFFSTRQRIRLSTISWQGFSIENFLSWKYWVSWFLMILELGERLALPTSPF